MASNGIAKKRIDETQREYERRAKEAQQAYITRCPGTCSAPTIAVWAEYWPDSPDANGEGYEVPLCCSCKDRRGRERARHTASNITQRAAAQKHEREWLEAKRQTDGEG